MAKKKMGRPSKYNEGVPQEMIDFFYAHLEKEEEYLAQRVVNGEDEVATFKTRGPKLPTFERFAIKLGVNTDTLHQWKKRFPDFNEAYKWCKDFQKDFITWQGLNGNYNTTWSIFFAKCNLGMNDKAAEQDNDKPKKLIIQMDGEDHESED